MTELQPHFKLIIVGDVGVGKHSFLNRHLVGDFEKRTVYDLNCEIRPFTFHTNYGEMTFDAHRFLGASADDDDCFNEMPDEYFIGAQAAIIMFDLTKRVSYRNVPRYYQNIVRICDNIPIILLGNKADIRDRKVQSKAILFHRKKNIQYYDVSAKANYNFEKPFIYLARRLAGTPDLAFVEAPALRPPEVEVDERAPYLHDNLETVTFAEDELEDDDDEYIPAPTVRREKLVKSAARGKNVREGPAPTRHIDALPVEFALTTSETVNGMIDDAKAAGERRQRIEDELQKAISEENDAKMKASQAFQPLKCPSCMNRIATVVVHPCKHCFCQPCSNNSGGTEQGASGDAAQESAVCATCNKAVEGAVDLPQLKQIADWDATTRSPFGGGFGFGGGGGGGGFGFGKGGAGALGGGFTFG